MIKEYYHLTKPGIIYGNLITAAGGFLLASKGHIQFGLFLAILAGTSLVIASACVFNNYIDRGIDQKMERTKQRAMVKGSISGPAALTYGAILFILGVAILAWYTNFLTLGIGLIAFIVYVAVYGVGKRRSVHGTIIGSVAGAAPVVAGYTTVTNRFDLGAFVLFAILVLWQMPHFYSIAMYRLDEYKAADIPVLPLKTSMRTTKIQILAYITAFIVAVVSLTVFGYAGYTYLVVMVLLGLAWLRLGSQGFKAKDDAAWARTMFRFSLVVILSLSVMLAVGSVLP